MQDATSFMSLRSMEWMESDLCHLVSEMLEYQKVKLDGRDICNTLIVVYCNSDQT